MMRSPRWIVLMGLALGLAACSPQLTASALERETPAPVVTPTAAAPFTPLPPTPVPTLTATITATEAPQPTPTAPPACHETAGAVITDTVASPTLRYAIDTRIYLPPCYAASGRRYPVLYLLHGLGFTQDQWERLGVAKAADTLIAADAIAPLIIVMPRDRRDDRLDPALVKDLVPYIDATYRTAAVREARAIGGLSRGGGWAAHFGLKYPELFSRIGLHSPAVFYDDETNILEWSRQLQKKPKPVVYVDSGEDDATIRSPLWLDQIFTWFKVPHTLVLQPGGHSEKYWSQHVAEYLQFYAADWRGVTFAGPPND